MVCAGMASWGVNSLFIFVYPPVMTHFQSLFFFLGDDSAHYHRPSCLLTKFLFNWFPCCDLLPEIPDASEAIRFLGSGYSDM